jgi:hypothetical protein
MRRRKLLKIDGVEITETVKSRIKNQKHIKEKEKFLNAKNPVNRSSARKISPEEIDILSYDKNGKIIIDSNKKQSIIDFFH